MPRILIVGKGGFGDMAPLLAMAEELVRRGHAVTVATGARHARACAHIGAAHQALGTAEAGDAAVQCGMPPGALADEVRRLLPLARDADLLVGNHLAYGAAIVRDLLRKPWVYCPASPLAIPSRRDPPLLPHVHRLQQATSKLGLPGHLYLQVVRGVLRWCLRAHPQLRRRLGVRFSAHPRFEAMYSRQLNLLPVSPLLLAAQSDWPASTLRTGFMWFESREPGDSRLGDTLSAFALGGEAPVVLVPDTSRRAAPDGFLTEAIAACKSIGRRAIVLAPPKQQAAQPGADRAERAGGLPYRQVFDHAAAVVHAGSIDALGWAMRAGLPSLLLPGAGDQFDNARRARRCGVARVLPADADARTIATQLHAILNDHAMHARLREVCAIVRAENGAAVACDAIERLPAMRP